ncbi:MAG: HAMP domain-containing sensor histidine kinase [Planctomycetota bacterium]|nr:HAMP domain-containing sensor histidine kinase [Planctomycetota bacterium]
MLYRIAEEAVRPSTSITSLLSRILNLALETAGADRGCILLRNLSSAGLKPVAYRDRRGEEAPGSMPVSRSIVDYVLKSRQGVRTSDARTDARFVPGQSIFQAGIREAICVPMQGRYELQGVIYLDITTPADRLVIEGRAATRFTEDLLRLMVAIGRQAALAVEDNQYQQALVKSERLAAVGQTITILSHHIKNILQGVRGGSYLIDMGLKDHDESLVRKGWTIVERNQDRIYQLVTDMLTLSKERQPALSRGDLNETVGEVCELMQARATELGVELTWTPCAGFPEMVFDAEALHRATLNIVGNALDAVEGHEHPQVRVATSFDPHSGVVAISVDDNGVGISPEVLPGLFNIFESTKGARGTGIGLAVSQKIIREHGGEIYVESQPGQGARFVLEWPLIGDEQGGLERRTEA